jgi:hypothetical protein
MRALQILLLVLLAWSSDTGMAQLSNLTPQPGLSPAQVVQYQVTALQHNDDPKSDAGIERAFQFASPANKQATGPLENFTQILKSPAYAPMLNNRSSEVVGSEVKENQAKVVVKIIAADGRQITYIFILSNQKEGEFINCWMTDAVAPFQQNQDSTDQDVRI